MNYDFDTIIDRYGTNSVKYDFAVERGKPEELLPMWLADMDFSVPPEVLADIQKAVSHGIFGYTEPKDDYYNAVAYWFGSRFGFGVKQHEIIKTPGVVFALGQIIRAFTKPDEAVLVQTPVYYPFYDIIRNNGRKLVTNPLVYNNGIYTGIYTGINTYIYTIDFDDFERKITDNKVRLFILCSPHNPVGRVWTREELEKINGICEKHGVLVVSDEIHCDFVWSGYTHTCFGLLNENSFIATSPSKTFNLAGLQVSNIFVKNEQLRNKLNVEIKKSGYSHLNTLGLAACKSAYTKGGAWLEAMKTYLEENIQLIREFLAERIPKIRLVEPEASYLIWLDFSQYELTQDELDRRITEGAKLRLSGGTSFGADGKDFQRINIACPRTTLHDALCRLEKEFKE